MVSSSMEGDGHLLHSLYTYRDTSIYIHIYTYTHIYIYILKGMPGDGHLLHPCTWEGESNHTPPCIYKGGRVTSSILGI